MRGERCTKASSSKPAADKNRAEAEAQGPRPLLSEASLSPEHQWELRGSHASGRRAGTGPGKSSRSWSLGHTSPVPLAHGPTPAGCRGQEATIVSLPEPGTVQALFLGLKEEEKKAKKGAAVLGRSGGGVETPSLPPERAPRPTSWEGSHVGPKDPATSKKLAGY